MVNYVTFMHGTLANMTEIQYETSSKDFNDKPEQCINMHYLNNVS